VHTVSYIRQIISPLAWALVLPLGCGEPAGDPPRYIHQESRADQAILPLKLKCKGSTDALGIHSRYEVYEWPDGTILAACTVSDRRRQSSGVEIYASDEGTDAAWAVCDVDFEVPGVPASSTPWHFRSHRDLNTAGVDYGGSQYALTCATKRGR
jgi:hypothetical protein